MTIRAVFAATATGFLLFAVTLVLGGCLMMIIPEAAESRIVLTHTRADTLDRIRSALAEFSVKYDYTLSGQYAGDGFAVIGYQIHTGLFVFTHPPHAKDRPSYVSASRRPNGSVVVSYED